MFVAGPGERLPPLCGSFFTPSLWEAQGEVLVFELGEPFLKFKIFIFKIKMGYKISLTSFAFLLGIRRATGILFRDGFYLKVLKLNETGFI